MIYDDNIIIAIDHLPTRENIVESHCKRFLINNTVINHASDVILNFHTIAWPSSAHIAGKQLHVVYIAASSDTNKNANRHASSRTHE